MQAGETDLAEWLSPRGPAIVSLAGGGGKTSLLFALGKAFAEKGRPTLCTATTKMRRPEATEWLAVDIRSGGGYREIPERGALFAALPPPKDVDQRKVVGFKPETIDEIRLKQPEAWIVVEADGAAGRPLKAPAEHEPVIPSRTGVAIAVIGLDCLNQPLSPDIAFRAERCAAISGLQNGERIAPEAIVNMLSHPEGLFKCVPPDALRLLFCNKSDLPGAPESGELLARAVRERCAGFLHGLFVGSVRTKGLRCRSFPVR